jgi:hypothetical protein
MADGTTSLGELRQQNQKVNNPFSSWFHRHCPFLFNIHSLFYFFWLTFGLGLLWMVYSLATNSGTQLLGWDYSYQYIPFGYQTWDCWHHFFDTGEFQLYSENTFLGSDNIGSNSYYGLFDPFVFFVVFFPRAWVPQLFAVAAMLKGAMGALTMRAYIKYLGGKEESARLGGFRLRLLRLSELHGRLPLDRQHVLHDSAHSLRHREGHQRKEASDFGFGPCLIGAHFLLLPRGHVHLRRALRSMALFRDHQKAQLER